MLVTSGFTQALVLTCRALRARGATPWRSRTRASASTVTRSRSPGSSRCRSRSTRKASSSTAWRAATSAQCSSRPPTPIRRAHAQRGSPRAMVAWARRASALMVEDDYDAEFRYDRRAIGALQGLAPERVGVRRLAARRSPGAAARLDRAGRLARRQPRVGEALRRHGHGLFEQLAFARLDREGDFPRHLRRVRPIYRRRRDAAIDAIARFLPAPPRPGSRRPARARRLPPESTRAARDAAHASGVFVEAGHGTGRTADGAAVARDRLRREPEPAIHRGITILGEHLALA